MNISTNPMHPNDIPRNICNSVPQIAPRNTDGSINSKNSSSNPRGSLIDIVFSMRGGKNVANSAIVLKNSMSHRPSSYALSINSIISILIMK